MCSGAAERSLPKCAVARPFRTAHSPGYLEMSNSPDGNSNDSLNLQTRVSMGFASAFASVSKALDGLSGKLPNKEVVEKKTKTAHPSKLCDLDGGRCVRPFGVGYARGASSFQLARLASCHLCTPWPQSPLPA